MAIKAHINPLLDIYKGTAPPSPLSIKFSQMNAYVKYFDKKQ